MNSLDLFNSMGFSVIEIPLTQGYRATIDIADAPKVLGYRWSVQRCPGGILYAVAHPSKRVVVLMHRLLCESAGQVDHRDHNGLNNRRANLRACQARQNQGNAQLRKDNTSGFKGVYRYYKKWRAAIRVYGKVVCLGAFSTPEEAAQAYDDAAKRVFGEFAATNSKLHS